MARAMVVVTTSTSVYGSLEIPSLTFADGGWTGPTGVLVSGKSKFWDVWVGDHLQWKQVPFLLSGVM